MYPKIVQELGFSCLLATEAAAIAAENFVGMGDKDSADNAAVEAMRKVFNESHIDGHIVIGEGERDEAPMLFIGEKVGKGGMGVSIAVDPLEGTNPCAYGTPGAVAVLAMSDEPERCEQGSNGLLNGPDGYMEHIAVGPGAAGIIDLDMPIKELVEKIGSSFTEVRKPYQLKFKVLNRPRHKKLIGEIRETGAHVLLIGDGDLSAAIMATLKGSGVHGVIGIGGAPEKVITAALLQATNGQILARFAHPDLLEDNARKIQMMIMKPERLEKMGISGDPYKKIFTKDDLAPGKNIIFCATAVTEIPYLHGVRSFGTGQKVWSLIAAKEDGKHSLIQVQHSMGNTNTVFPVI